MVIRTITASHWAFQNCLKGKTVCISVGCFWVVKVAVPERNQQVSLLLFQAKGSSRRCWRAEMNHHAQCLTMWRTWTCRDMAVTQQKHTAGSGRETSVSIQTKGPCDVETFVEKFEYNQAKNTAFNFLKSRIWTAKESSDPTSQKSACVCAHSYLSPFLRPSHNTYHTI